MAKPGREHVLIFPFMAKGHIIPFLALALELEATHNLRITFINTPLNLRNLRSALPPASAIRLRSLPFDASQHGLPPGTENTDALPYHLVFRLMDASFSLEPQLRALLSEIVAEDNAAGGRPLCIITDMFFTWVGRVAHDFGISHAIFAATSALGLACYYSLWSTVPKWKIEGESEFSMADFPEGGKVHITQLPASMAAADGEDEWSVFQRRMLSEWYNADAALFNTVEELDRVGLEYFRRKIRIPVWAIGPVVSKNRSEKDEYGCKAWLDSKPARSVLYVCFGSQNSLTKEQMWEMAEGLEGCGRRFIWVVRPPVGMELEGEFRAEEWLPEGFERRVEGRGLVVRRWAPQEVVLGHGATGGFVSHCGWNSVVEALSYGVPVIGWPMAGEQFFNVKLVAGELGVCVELGRGNGCEVKRDEIVRKIEMVMGESDEARDLRRRACLVREIVQGAKREGEQKGSSARAIDEFLKAAIERREKSLDVRLVPGTNGAQN